MTNKELFKLAGNDEARYYLEEIGIELRNMCHKDIYEQRKARNKIRAYANVIRTILIEEDLDERR